eukprot:CAMPEP_0204502472 /NCGR_PEP_ID=MMETSP0471-20130131/101338_1 /ASSEMBLY_ACC=CAM_ASM_000602 /TAXON_ID=2969 /ORGANISM="Oxyrrhis marina" /LENGTH=43 /DNA_ID= /DNA_START= /DNA_END= /DNA_ORIENTATION=
MQHFFTQWKHPTARKTATPEHREAQPSRALKPGPSCGKISASG